MAGSNKGYGGYRRRRYTGLGGDAAEDHPDKSPSPNRGSAKTSNDLGGSSRARVPCSLFSKPAMSPVFQEKCLHEPLNLR